MTRGINKEEAAEVVSTAVAAELKKRDETDLRNARRLIDTLERQVADLEIANAALKVDVNAMAEDIKIAYALRSIMVPVVQREVARQVKAEMEKLMLHPIFQPAGTNPPGQGQAPRQPNNPKG